MGKLDSSITGSAGYARSWGRRRCYSLGNEDGGIDGARTQWRANCCWRLWALSLEFISNRDGAHKKMAYMAASEDSPSVCWMIKMSRAECMHVDGRWRTGAGTCSPCPGTCKS